MMQHRSGRYKSLFFIFEASRDYLIAQFGDPEPGWVVKATA